MALNKKLEIKYLTRVILYIAKHRKDSKKFLSNLKIKIPKNIKINKQK